MDGNRIIVLQVLKRIPSHLSLAPFPSGRLPLRTLPRADPMPARPGPIPADVMTRGLVAIVPAGIPSPPATPDPSASAHPTRFPAPPARPPLEVPTPLSGLPTPSAAAASVEPSAVPRGGDCCEVAAAADEEDDNNRAPPLPLPARRPGVVDAVEGSRRRGPSSLPSRPTSTVTTPDAAATNDGDEDGESWAGGAAAATLLSPRKSGVVER